MPFKENIQEYFEREVRPHVPDARIGHDKTVKGYQIAFTKVTARMRGSLRMRKLLN